MSRTIFTTSFVFWVFWISNAISDDNSEDHNTLLPSQVDRIIQEIKTNCETQQQAIKTAEFTIKCQVNSGGGLKKLNGNEVHKIVEENIKNHSEMDAFRRILINLNNIGSNISEDKYLFGVINVVQEGDNVRNIYTDGDLEHFKRNYTV